MLALLASIPLLVPQNPAPPVDWAELMRRFQADAAALGKAGAPLDLAALKLENLEPGEIARENSKRETAFFGESWFEMLWVLSRSFGLQVDATADAFRVSFLRLSSDSLAAWYLPARKSIVIDEAHYTTDARLDRALLHALALAYLDQQPGGLAALRRAGSTDELLASRGWIEGRAELCARRAGGAGPRASLVAFEERTGGFTLVDLAGQSEAARQELLPEAQRALPANSAALLHGRARPTCATLGIEGLAPVGAKLLREDTLGELGLRFVLSLAGAHPVRAIESGIGLAADRLRLWQYGEREREFVWRLCFDRESDAVELEQLLGKLARGTRVRHGHVIDWCYATLPEREAELAKLVAALPPAAPPSEADARLSAEIQAARLALQPHMQGERWLLPELDLAWKLPGGWRPSFFQYEVIVYIGAPEDGFRDNLTFHQYRLPPDATPEKVLEGAKQSFEGLAGTKLLRAELVLTPAGRGVRVEYVQQTSGRELHQLELQLVLPGSKQAITATLLEKHWKAAGAGIEAFLATTERIRQAPAPGAPK
jgi:hypothetical protein